MQGWLHRSANLTGRMAAMKGGLHLSFDQLAPGFVTPPEFVAGLLQRVDRRSREFFLHQNVIRVKSRDGEDGDAVARQRLDEGEQDSCLGEGERAFQLQADPARA